MMFWGVNGTLVIRVVSRCRSSCFPDWQVGTIDILFNIHQQPSKVDHKALRAGVLHYQHPGKNHPSPINLLSSGLVHTNKQSDFEQLHWDTG